MTSQAISTSLKSLRYPREIISYAVWAYFRFSMSLRDVEDLLAKRGILISYETIRVWVDRFGHQFARFIRRDRPGGHFYSGGDTQPPSPPGTPLNSPECTQFNRAPRCGCRFFLGGYPATSCTSIGAIVC